MSVRSGSVRSSKSSTRSSLQLTAAEARADIAVQRAREAFAAKRAEEQRKRLEADLELEKLLREEALAAAEARAEMIQAELERLDLFEERSDVLESLPNETPNQRVEEYLAEIPEQPESPVHSEASSEAEIVRTKLPESPTKQEVACESVKPAWNINAPPFVSTNAECVKILARQRLPIQEPDKYSGDPILFLSWRRAFESMVNAACVPTVEKLSFLGKYTTGPAKTLVDRFRLRNVNDAEKAYTGELAELQKRFGNPTVISAEVIKSLSSLPRFNADDINRLQELADRCEDTVAQMPDVPHLTFLNTPHGINPIVEKLPNILINKWRERVAAYKRKCGQFPPFSYFAEFISERAEMLRDPDIPRSCSDSRINAKLNNMGAKREVVNVRKTAVNTEVKCPIHKSPHPLNKCRAFLEKSVDEKQAFLKEQKICFRCLSSTSHMAKNCKVDVKCDECGSSRHLTALHFPKSTQRPQTKNGGEPQRQLQEQVQSSCTEICEKDGLARSCAKICLVNIYRQCNPDNVVQGYAIIDDQSNKTLAKAELFDALGSEGPPARYTLKTCAGSTSLVGRQLGDMIVQSVDGQKCLKMPTVIECENIPGNKLEIPTPETASKFPHLKSIANKIPQLQPDTPILILLGRDIPQAHKIRELRNGPNSAPWGQRLDLGWVVVGNMCLGGAHQKEDITSCRTQVLLNGRPSVNFDACQNAIKVSNLGNHVFKREADDDRIGMSIEDNEFLDLMNHEMEKDKGGNWEAPLPFRLNRSVLPNNKSQAESRMKSLIRTLEKKPVMKTHYFEFMAKILQKGHAERVNDSQNSDKECWYLPHFGVYHSQKPDKIRVVFDSSAEFQGISLNSVLLSGPDLVNQLLGVLIRFRENPVAVMADVEQMFYAFKVKEQHRDYLRFLWFEDNDPDANRVTYRMKVHIFGNRPSPAVATLGLRRTAKEGESEFGSDARAFVESNFYVDDGLKSFASAREAVDLLTRTRNMLATANIKLHKIASNDKEVMAAFAPSDLAPNVQEVDLGSDAPVMQRSLCIGI